MKKIWTEPKFEILSIKGGVRVFYIEGTSYGPVS